MRLVDACSECSCEESFLPLRAVDTRTSHDKQPSLDHCNSLPPSATSGLLACLPRRTVSATVGFKCVSTVETNEAAEVIDSSITFQFFARADNRFHIYVRGLRSAETIVAFVSPLEDNAITTSTLLLYAIYMHAIRAYIQIYTHKYCRLIDIHA